MRKENHNACRYTAQVRQYFENSSTFRFREFYLCLCSLCRNNHLKLVARLRFLHGTGVHRLLLKSLHTRELLASPCRPDAKALVCKNFQSNLALMHSYNQRNGPSGPFRFLSDLTSVICQMIQMNSSVFYQISP